MNGRKGGTTTKKDGGLWKPSGSQEETPLSPGQGKRWVGVQRAAWGELHNLGGRHASWSGGGVGGGKLEEKSKT